MERGFRRPCLPGQVVIGGFPRFGTSISAPPPAVPRDPVIQVRGAVAEGFDVPLSALDALPRQDLRADFHCVSGWSATGLSWAGVPFASFYRTYVEPALAPDVVVTHLVFRGYDGFRSVLTIEDALADDVLVADHLDGEPLAGDHGAPARLVSPRQYGYLSTKHLCRIDVHTSEPTHVQRSWALRGPGAAPAGAGRRGGAAPVRPCLGAPASLPVPDAPPAASEPGGLLTRRCEARNGRHDPQR